MAAAERIYNAKGTESKSAGKMEREKARKKIRNDPNFGYCACHQIEIFQIFLPNLRGIYVWYKV